MAFLGFARVDFPFAGQSTQFLSAIYPGTAFVDSSTVTTNALASYDEVRNIGGNLWFVINAAWDPTGLRWLQVDPSKASSALEVVIGGGAAFWLAAAVGGVATNVPITFLPVGAGIVTAPTVVPQGRLTLTTGLPVMTTDVANAGTIFYTPYVGCLVPIFSGTANWSTTAFSQMPLVLDTVHHPVNTVHDVFVFLNAGILTLVAGPAWSTTTARGVGAGTTQIQQQNGVWVNTVSMTAFNNNVSFTVPALQGTYLGSFFCNGNAQVSITGLASIVPVAGGAIMGLYNAYNRVIIQSKVRDNGGGYAVVSAGVWQAARNDTSMRVQFLDGLQQSYIYMQTSQDAFTVTATNALCGVSVNSTVTAPNIQSKITSNGTTNMESVLFMADVNTPILGLNFLQAMVQASSNVLANANFNTAVAGSITVRADC